MIIIKWRKHISKCFILFVFGCSPVVETSEEFAINGKFDIEKSIEYLDKIIDHDRGNADALFQRSKLELQIKKTLKAKEDILTAISIDPENTDFLMLKAQIDAEIGQNEEAINSIESILKKGENLNTVEAQLFATNLYLNVNNLNKAEYFLQQAALIAPGLPEVLYNRARLAMIRHDTAKAVIFYNVILKKDSTHSNTLIDLAEINLKRSNVDSALVLLSKVNTDKPFKYNVLLAESLTKKGFADSASKFWGQALLLTPRDARSHYELGKHYYSKNLFQNAITHFTAVLENERKGYKDFYLMLAYSYEQSSDSIRAAQYMERARKIDSNVVIHKILQHKHLHHNTDIEKPVSILPQ
ncbi:MAG: tetratricopeptide repeat protein [Opitutaceae bacterium]|nr:tetratricopeptide repeat protein [Cytophagales bacterium]